MKLPNEVTACLSILILLSLFAGCVTTNRIQGEHYIRQERYSEGESVFREKLGRDPFDITANYYLGRYLLALDRPREAVRYLKEAAELDYYNADYYYWLGNCYHALRNVRAERQNYQRALELDPGHLYARLDLGHSYLENRNWKKALTSYEKVLKHYPEQPQALYNRGLVLNKLKQSTAEIEAWKAYLAIYPNGKWAIRAVDHLNAQGDFSYRNYSIGNRRIPLAHIGFSGNTGRLTPASKQSLNEIGSVLSINRKIHLRITAHEKGSKKLARHRANRVRDYLINGHPVIDPKRIDVSAKAGPERIKAGRRVFPLRSSIKIVTLKK